MSRPVVSFSVMMLTVFVEATVGRRGRASTTLGETGVATRLRIGRSVPREMEMAAWESQFTSRPRPRVGCIAVFARSSIRELRTSRRPMTSLRPLTQDGREPDARMTSDRVRAATFRSVDRISRDSEDGEAWHWEESAMSPGIVVEAGGVCGSQVVAGVDTTLARDGVDAEETGAGSEDAESCLPDVDRSGDVDASLAGADGEGGPREVEGDRLNV